MLHILFLYRTIELGKVKYEISLGDIEPSFKVLLFIFFVLHMLHLKQSFSRFSSPSSFVFVFFFFFFVLFDQPNYCFLFSSKSLWAFISSCFIQLYIGIANFTRICFTTKIYFTSTNVRIYIVFERILSLSFIALVYTSNALLSFSFNKETMLFFNILYHILSFIF